MELLKGRQILCPRRRNKRRPWSGHDGRRRSGGERRYRWGGNPRDVLALPLALSMGDIREPMGETRRMLLEHWYEEIMERDWRRTLEAAGSV